MLSYLIHKTSFRIVTSVAEAADVNSNGIETLANDVSSFFINSKPADIIGSRKLRNLLS